MAIKPITNYTKVTNFENQQTHSLRCDLFIQVSLQIHFTSLFALYGKCVYDCCSHTLLTR